MKQRVVFSGFSYILVVMSLGCGMPSRYAAMVIENAKSQILSAQAVDAQNLAAETYGEAERLLSDADSAMHHGKTEEAYRLGRRAILVGKLAESVAVAKTIETRARSMEKTLELKMQTLENAKRELEQADQEFDRYELTPAD